MNFARDPRGIKWIAYLHERDEQEEAVAVAAELLEQEQRYERQTRVLRRGNVIVLVLRRLMGGIDENDPLFAVILLRGWLIVALRATIFRPYRTNCNTRTFALHTFAHIYGIYFYIIPG